LGQQLKKLTDPYAEHCQILERKFKKAVEKVRFYERLCRKKGTSTHISGELDEAVEHVESVEVDGGRGHCVVPQTQRLPQLLYEPRNNQIS
jgi:hypothetical protein